MRLGRDLRKTRQRKRDLNRLKRLVESGENRLSVKIGARYGGLKASVQRLDNPFCGPKLVLSWTDDNQLVIEGGGLERLRDFLNKHFPPPEKKSNGQ